MNTPIPIDAIEKAAKAATKGPYMAGAYGAIGDVSVVDEDGSAVGDSVLMVQSIYGDSYDHKQRIANTEYFAMLDPATVRELVRGYKEHDALAEERKAIVERLERIEAARDEAIQRLGLVGSEDLATEHGSYEVGHALAALLLVQDGSPLLATLRGES